MTTKPLVKSWSFSKLQLYRQCPQKYKFIAIDRLQEPKSPAMARGAEVHEMAEAYVKGTLKKMPPELAKFKDEFNMLKALYKKKAKLPMIVEDNWAFTAAWEETQWNDWVGCWVRIKLDCAHHLDEQTLIVTDYKTGKFRTESHEEYLMQMELYALAALLLHEHVTVVQPRLLYLDTGDTYPAEPISYTRKDIPELKKTWERRVAPLFKDKRFAPKPNALCKWCHFRAGNAAAGGGQCKY